MRDDISNEYLDYLENIACGDDSVLKHSYQKLFTILSTTEFIVNPVCPRDENRLMAGVELRASFAEEYGYSNKEIRASINYPCSVLEMMVALSIYIEQNVMDNPIYGDRTCQWFWGMVSSLGLGTADDRHFDVGAVIFTLNRFMNREYEPNGRGGLFTVDNPDCDMRDIEIWWQATRYLNQQLR